MEQLSVLIVDDYDVVRSGVRAMLEAADGIVVVAEATTAADAIEEAIRTRPNVVLMDVRLAEGTGIEAAREIRVRLPDTRVLMLTSFADDDAMMASSLAGASGYVLKEVAGGRIVESVRAVARGEELLDPSTTGRVRNRLDRGKHLRDQKLALLSPQEERVIEQMALGKTNHEIAKSLDLSEKTVKNYVSNVLMKLGMSRRSEAAAYAARLAERRRHEGAD
jgi:DNA-binding NarL/FixJ family response regulator